MDQKVKAQNSIKVRLVFSFFIVTLATGILLILSDSEKRINQVVSKLY